jgi:hypothetical protein
MSRAANQFSEVVQQLTILLGHGYGSPIEQLVDELRIVEARKVREGQG